MKSARMLLKACTCYYIRLHADTVNPVLFLWIMSYYQLACVTSPCNACSDQRRDIKIAFRISQAACNLIIVYFLPVNSIYGSEINKPGPSWGN